MTGLLLAKPWEGHRNEAFAEYVLSSIATVVRVPRQADFGFDLLCTLTRYAGNVLYAGRSFGVQVKPISDKKIGYGGVKKKKWKRYEINWLFKQDQPLFLGIVDLENHSLCLYSTHRMWWLYNEIDRNPGKIVLMPDVQPQGNVSMNWFNRRRLPLLDRGKKAGDGFSYQIPLGEPVAKIELELLESEDPEDRWLRSRMETTIKDAIDLNYRNIMNSKSKIAITEDQDVWTGGIYKHSIYYHATNDDNKKELFISISNAITSLLQNYNLISENDLGPF